MQNVNSEILDRLPPQDLQAEKQAIGSLMQDARMADEIAPIIKPDDFYSESNQKLFRHVMAISLENRWIDATILANRLKKHGDYEAVGGAEYLIEVARSVPYAANAVYYARIVREKSIRRNTIHTLTEALRDAWDETNDAGEIISIVESSLSAINTSKGESHLKSASEATVDALAYLDEISNRHEASGLMTGLDILDQNYSILNRKELIILAARPSVGKTSLARQIARHNGESGRMPYFVSLEMDTTQQTILSWCSMAGVDGQRVRNVEMSPTESAKLAKASNRYGQFPIFIEDRPRMKTADILRTARRLKRQDLRLIVVDYLQLIEPSNRKVDRHLQVGEIARDLKNMAMELDVPVLCLAQINRESMNSKSGPELHHLKESGDVEQHADVVMFLHDDYLLIKKNRNGPKGKIKLHWNPKTTTFTCADEPPPSNYSPELGEYGG